MRVPSDLEVCPNSNPEGLLSDGVIFPHNLMWTLAYYYGLWFTHGDLGVLGGISLTWNSFINRWTITQKVLMTSVAVFDAIFLFYFVDLTWYSGP
jgi:hypothetical protein